MQRKLNTHIYFKPWQCIWEGEMEAGLIQGIKAGVTQARKGGLIRIHVYVQSQSDPCKGRRIRRAGLLMCLKVHGSMTTAGKGKGVVGGSNGIAMAH